MSETIHFNTGRLYTAHGQRISATQHDDGKVTFYDHDRMIDGEVEVISFNRLEVMVRYDRGMYKSTERSRRDGLYEGGTNQVYPD